AQPAPAAGPAAPAQTAPSAGSAPAPTGPSAGSAPAPTATPTPSAGPRKRATGIVDARYTVSLRFGRPGKSEPIAGLERLRPLPSAKDPFFVFIGVLRGGKVARFLVSSDVKTTGDATCRPRRSLCQTIDMQPGDSQRFEFDLGPDGVRRFEIDLTAIRPATGRAGAAASRAQTSGAPGRFDVLRADVRFGPRPEGSGSSRTRRDVARLASFPPEGAPVVQFLGALADRRTAIFMVAPGVTPAGTRACLGDAECRVLALRTGEGATLRSAAGEHRLDLLSLRRTIARSATAAGRAHRREHPAGRRTMRTFISDRHTAWAFSRFSFSPLTGTVKRR
ncbi:MAG: hypothetical protein H0T43_11485, partial [Solirubrobacterales bacterium]|nr:hypothetical protein [Solirubrobacterales bacterium]